ncbi:MAG: CYTH and CHAD domain-containing protein [Actinomycetota bacterium]|nr:CYTH and CHAD domain-containing protein [Actinomycetota bacterium]
MREREVKLTLPSGTTLPAPESLVDGLGDWSIEQVDQHATYFDTRDLALTRAGASLRYRSDDGWTVKIPRPRDGATFVRDEYGFAGPEGRPPDAATDLVQAWTRSQSVSEVARVHTKRRKIHLYDQRRQPVVEIDEDDVVATDGTGRTSRFREVEVESTGADGPDLVDTLVDRLQEAGAVPGDPMPKVARALGDRAAKPPDLTRPAPIDKAATVEELVGSSIARGTQHLIDHDPLVRVGEDAEGVHQARVATRRLRSDLQTFRPILDVGWCESLRTELHWLGELLGHVRDVDVLLVHLAEKGERLTDEQRTNLNEMIHRLQDMRSRDLTALLDAMRSERYTALLDHLVAAARSPRIRTEANGRAASQVVAKLVRRPVRRLRKHIGHFEKVPANADLHEARKRAKQARYALEAAAPVLGKRATRQARRLAELQGILGDHQDAVVAGAWLHEAARDAAGSETPFVAGYLACLFDADRARLRKRWPSTWKRAQRLLD